MAGAKRCPGCLAVYEEKHWVHQRENCPACGARLIVLRGGEGFGLAYEHYDSNVDIHFDLSGLLNPGQRREAWIIGATGAVLILLAFAARMFFAALGRREGFWNMPLWFDLLVGLMIFIGTAALLWSLQRLWRHRRAARRRA